MILAVPSTDHIYERWGHALLRFVSSEGNPGADYVLEFVAMVPDDNPSLRKGLFGGYPAAPQFSSLRSFWREYVADEDRDLIRAIIPTSPAMRQRIFQTLQNWIADPKKNLHDYNFPDNNCAGLMTRFLQAAGFPYSGIRARIPDHIMRYLKRLLLNPYPELVVSNQKTPDLKLVPAPLYGVCADSACVEKLTELEKQLWSDDELADAKKGRAQTARKTLKHPHESVLAATEVVKHFELLLDADSSSDIN